MPYVIQFVLISFLLFISCTSEKESSSPWDEDICFFATELESGHPDLFFQISKEEFEDAIATLRASSVTLDSDMIVFELFKILTRIGDSHTSLVLNQSHRRYPFLVEELEDGLVITGISQEQKEYNGRLIESINGILIIDILNGLREVIPHQNNSDFKRQISSYLNLALVLEGFDYSESGEPLRLKLVSGEELNLNRKQGKIIGLEESIQLPKYLRTKDVNYRYAYMDAENMIYIQYNAAKEISNYSFTTFTSQIKESIDKNQDIFKVVIDLRLNGGGNSAIAKPLIDLVHDYIREGRFMNNEVFVIIGRKTFSSALLNAIEMKEKFSPVFVGEPTGGKPNSFGELSRFVLPQSRIVIYHSTKFFKIVESDPSSLFPDVNIIYTSDDLLGGIDPALDYILKQ